jgi:nucleoside-diphosphate-sugar epimerase
MITLVTGGNGFIGRAIVEQLLARGDRVRVVGRGDYPELRALGAECFRVDLAEPQRGGGLDAALRGCELVFHVAAKAGIWGPWPEYYRNNVSATQRLLRAAVAADVPKLVFTSSPSVVFGEESVEGVDESQPYPRRYLAPYSWSKALAEQYVLRQRDILTTAIRPPFVWGPRDTNIIPRILGRARSGRLVQVGDGANLVDVTYVENAAEAHLLAADALGERSPARGRAYFIGQEQPVNLWGFINSLLTGYGLAPVRRSIPLPLALGVATAMEQVYRLAGSAEEPPFTRLLVTQLARSRWFDLSAARRDLGYGPRIPTEEGMRRTLAAAGR